MRRLLASGAAVVLLAGCGSSPGGKQGVGERQWAANASGVIDQLRQDEALSSDGGTSLASARHALRDDSDLYALVLAYSDFGGCRSMVDNAGATTLRFRRVLDTLDEACVRLERAAALFTRSAARNDPEALIAASKEAQRAWPLLDRARLQLALTGRQR